MREDPGWGVRWKDILTRPDAYDEAMDFYRAYPDLFPHPFDCHFPVQWRYRQLFG